MGGQIALPGFEQGGHFFMSVDRLQSIPKRAPIAVVEYYSRAAICLDPLRERSHNKGGLRAEFNEVAVFRIAQAMIQSGERGRDA